MKKRIVFLVVMAMFLPVVCQAFTFTDLVAKLQRSDEFAKNKLRWIQQKADRQFQNEKLVSMVLLAQDTYKAYQSVNHAIDEIQAFTLNPTITVYNQNGDGFAYGIRNHELTVWEHAAAIQQAKLNQNPLYQESPDYQRYDQKMQTLIKEDYSRQNEYKKWLDEIRKELDERDKILRAILDSNKAVVTGNPTVNASYQRAIMIRLQVEQSETLLEIGYLLYNRIADDYHASVVMQRAENLRGNLTPVGAEKHNIKYIKKLFSESQEGGNQ